ncbi:C-terminal binding protein [Haloarchaeobius sp. HME9146]|uniref:C-terminal binding protein n=1 Tax=Haloarchaeobius sp. HME9146 TaxID=2978732 RepID=UPI0021C20F5B|nr:C-terminal binding protein [Haloarchaeobius sp. HME9146]MCT9098475.1 C-terminal binding protein [Haloarchaeobius sp. HME9146]
MYSVLLSDHPKLDPEVFQRILGPDAEIHERRLGSAEAVLEAAREVDADAVVANVDTPVPANVIEALDLTVIARSAVGVDGIDLDAAAAADVQVVNCPEYCTDEVAIHALSLALACVRSIPAYDRSVRAGEWDWGGTRELHRLRGQTIGLLAFGPIARRFTELVSGFDCRLVAHDPYVESGTMADYGVEAVDFETLLDDSDLLSVHAPLTDETRGMLDTDAFDRLGPGAVLVNTGRGAVIDEDALVAALESGQVAAAGLDVLTEEPPADSPLVGREDTVVTPHAGWYSEEARRDVNETIAADVKRALDGEEPENVVQQSW